MKRALSRALRTRFAPDGKHERRLAIDDIVELGVPWLRLSSRPPKKLISPSHDPQEDTLPPRPSPQETTKRLRQEQPFQAIPETPEQEPALPTKDGQKEPAFQDAEQESEASDEAIRCLA